MEETRFRIIYEDENEAKVFYNSEDVIEINLLRRIILSEIKTWAIDIVTIHINTSPRQDEILALRLGQLPISQSEITNKEIRIDFTATENYVEFTTNDIKELSFKKTIPIVSLRKGQRILCDIKLIKNNAKTHVKWRPVSTVYFEKEETGGYHFFIDKIGMMDASDIIKKGIKYMKNMSSDIEISENIFFKPLLPKILENIESEEE